MSGINKRARYTAIGFAVSKFVFPLVKRQAKKKVRSTATNAADTTKRAVTTHPARTAIAVGAAVGAAGWVFSRTRGWGVGDDNGADHNGE